MLPISRTWSCHRVYSLQYSMSLVYLQTILLEHEQVFSISLSLPVVNNILLFLTLYKNEPMHECLLPPYTQLRQIGNVLRDISLLSRRAMVDETRILF